MEIPGKGPQTTSLWSEVGTASTTISFTVRAGQGRGGLPAHHRAGADDPALGVGALASRQRYETAKASLDVVDGFRSRGIPFDNIVQDWFYWKEDTWARTNSTRPLSRSGWVGPQDPREARPSHDLGVGKFYPGTKNFEAMRSQGFLYGLNLSEGLRDWVGDGGYPYTFYDAFNPEAGKLFWSQMEQSLFRKKVDAWWLDAPEPDLLPTPRSMDSAPTCTRPRSAPVRACSMRIR